MNSDPVDVEAAVRALRAGKPVVLPTDTVYGLCAGPRPGPVRALYALKGRGGEQPTALVSASVDFLLDLVPELRGRAETIARALLPGPYTLVLPNPARRLPWLTASRPDTIGVRVPDLVGPGGLVLEQAAVLAATSANRPGEPDPARLSDVPEEIRAGSGAVIDGGALPGTPSTVLDLTGPEPIVLREGAAASGEALARISALL